MPTHCSVGVCRFSFQSRHLTWFSWHLELFFFFFLHWHNILQHLNISQHHICRVYRGKDSKYPRDICEEKDALLKSQGQRSAWADWLEIVERQQPKLPLATTKLGRVASLNVRHLQPSSSMHSPSTPSSTQCELGVPNHVASIPGIDCPCAAEPQTDHQRDSSRDISASHRDHRWSSSVA